MDLSEKPFFLIAACLLLGVASIVLAWIKHGRDVLPLDASVLIVPYLANKLSFYAASRQVAGFHVGSEPIAVNWSGH
jgi:hypothetical protein